MKELFLKESHAPYTVTLDEETLTDESLLVDQDGTPLGVLIPIERYAAYKTWRETQADERRAPSDQDRWEYPSVQLPQPFWIGAEIETLIRVQGIQSIERLDALWGTFWPDDEPIDDFILAVREWRQQDLTPV